MIGQERELGTNLGAKRLRNVGGIYTDGENLDAGCGDFLVKLMQLAQLRRAKRSPVSTVEEIECGTDALQTCRVESLTVGVGERETGETIANLEAKLVSRKPRVAGYVPIPSCYSQNDSWNQERGTVQDRRFLNQGVKPYSRRERPNYVVLDRDPSIVAEES